MKESLPLLFYNDPLLYLLTIETKENNEDPKAAGIPNNRNKSVKMETHKEGTPERERPLCATKLLSIKRDL